MLIGITGGIGSGKSTISAQLRQWGYAVYDTDREAKRIIVQVPEVRHQMVQLFGEDIYANGQYQTTIVAAQVFDHPDILARLNQIVHPAVARDLSQWRRAHETHNPAAVLFVECAILYEAGLAPLCDRVVAVTAPEDIRINRTMARDHTDINKVRARIRAQKRDTDLLADISLCNDGTTSIEQLTKQLLDCLE